MSYDTALAQWKTRTEATNPPPEDVVCTAHRAGVDPQIVSVARAWWIRGCLGVVSSAFVAMAVIESTHESPAQGGRAFAVSLPIISLMFAMRWLRVRELGKQMMARALVWSSLVIGVLISVVGVPVYDVVGVPVSLGAGAALLLMGGRGLGVNSPSFRPAAFRSHLLIALVLATADAQTLLFSLSLKLGVFGQQVLAGNHLRWDHVASQTLPLMACSAVMVGAVLGIYRLRTWALLLNLVANIGIAYFAMSGAIGLTLPVATALATTAMMQLMLPVPILAAALGDRLRDRRPWGRFGAPAVKLGLAMMMLIGAMGPMVPEQIREGSGYLVVRTGWVERTRRAWQRGIQPPRSRTETRTSAPR